MSEDKPDVKDLDENPLDRMLSTEPEVVEKKTVKSRVKKNIVAKTPQQKRKRGRPKEGFKLYSVYMEPEMWADMKWLANRIGVKTRSALVRMLISRLGTRIRAADYARETAEKNMAGAEKNP